MPIQEYRGIVHRNFPIFTVSYVSVIERGSNYNVTYINFIREKLDEKFGRFFFCNLLGLSRFAR